MAKQKTDKIVWTAYADHVHRAVVNGRAIWVWRAEPGVWNYGTAGVAPLADKGAYLATMLAGLSRGNHDIVNRYSAPTVHLAKADAIAFANKLRPEDRPRRIRYLGLMRTMWDIHPDSDVAADPVCAIDAPAVTEAAVMAEAQHQVTQAPNAQHQVTEAPTAVTEAAVTADAQHQVTEAPEADKAPACAILSTRKQPERFNLHEAPRFNSHDLHCAYVRGLQTALLAAERCPTAFAFNVAADIRAIMEKV